MNCYEFKANLVYDIDFVVSVSMDEYPFFSGDIKFSSATQSRREQRCGNGWPRRYGYKCDRFKITMRQWNGVVAQLPDRWDTSGLTPTRAPYAFHSSDDLTPKPWDASDPFYARAVGIWETQNRYDKVGYFWLGNFDIFDPSNIFIAFERFENGAQGIMYVGLRFPWDVENPVGTASLKIEKKQS